MARAVMEKGNGSGNTWGFNLILFEDRKRTNKAGTIL